jgi:hypothetical protein
VNEVVTQVGTDVSGFSGRLDGLATSPDDALKAASATLGNASRTFAQGFLGTSDAGAC